MKLKLISHDCQEWDIKDLPINEWYEVISINHKGTEEVLDIRTQYGSVCWIPRSLFQSVEQDREHKLNNLLS